MELLYDLADIKAFKYNLFKITEGGEALIGTYSPDNGRSHSVGTDNLTPGQYVFRVVLGSVLMPQQYNAFVWGPIGAYTNGVYFTITPMGGCEFNGIPGGGQPTVVHAIYCSNHVEWYQGAPLFFGCSDGYYTVSSQNPASCTSDASYHFQCIHGDGSPFSIAVPNTALGHEIVPMENGYTPLGCVQDEVQYWICKRGCPETINREVLTVARGYHIMGKEEASGTVGWIYSWCTETMWNCYESKHFYDLDRWNELMGLIEPTSGQIVSTVLAFPMVLTDPAGMNMPLAAPGDGVSAAAVYEDSKAATAAIDVVHKDKDTGAILKQDSYAVNPGYYGPYNAMGFSGYGPGWLMADGAAASGLINAGQAITITYVYGKIPAEEAANLLSDTPATATIHVNHKDKDTGELLKQDSYTVNAGFYNAYQASTFSGYGSGWLMAGSDPASGLINVGQTMTITYLYTKNAQPTPLLTSATIEVTHKDRDTGEVLKQDAYTVNPGYYGPYNAMAFSGYGQGSLAWYSESAFDTINGGETRSIVFEYAFEPIAAPPPGANAPALEPAPATATIIVMHVDRDTGEILYEDELTVPAGFYGPFETYPFTGYGPGSLALDSDPEFGTIERGETKTIIFAYALVEIVPLDFEPAPDNPDESSYVVF